MHHELINLAWLQAAHLAQGEGGVYLASQNHNGHPIGPAPKVLALSPVVSLALEHITSGLQGMQVSSDVLN